MFFFVILYRVLSGILKSFDCPELIFFRVTLVTIAIMFHNPILILALWARLLRF